MMPKIGCGQGENWHSENWSEPHQIALSTRMAQIHIEQIYRQIDHRTFLAGIYALNINTQSTWPNGFSTIKQRVWWLLLILFLSHGPPYGIGLAGPTKRQKAPQPENLPESEVIERDAFRLLVGPKPDFRITPESKKTNETIQTGSELAWSQLISGSTLDDEIKTAMPRLKKIVATKTFFDSHIGDAIDEFRLLSVCFGIISAYDKEEDVRSSWKKNAMMNTTFLDNNILVLA